MAVESVAHQNPRVVTIKVVMEDELLRRVDKAVERMNVNRSALVRQALREHLARLQARDREEADRRGYERAPEGSELPAWNSVVTWPED